MNAKKTRIIVYLSLAGAVAVALFYVFRSQNLQKRLRASEEKESELAEKMSDYQELLRIDSLLVDGKYNTALRAYIEQYENKDMDDATGVRLRIDLAQKLLSFRRSDADGAAQAERDSLDSIQRTQVAAPREIRQYDSLNFALEKAKVQLAGMRRQLKEKSFGEYLKFKSKKGSQMHYVGQVKKDKASGYGVALLNTGSRYEGEWKNNQRHGQGSFYWPDGEYYVGSYVDDQRTGQGTYFWPNGDKYVGEWKADKRNGRGTFYDKKGEIVTSGTWKEDKLVEEDKE